MDMLPTGAEILMPLTADGSKPLTVMLPAGTAIALLAVAETDGENPARDIEASGTAM
jgi:hypothetical protein